MIDDSRRTVQAYLASGIATSEGNATFEQPPQARDAYISSITLRNEYGEIASRFDVLTPITVEIAFTCTRRFVSWRIFASVSRYDGVTVFSTTTWDYKPDKPPIDPGSYLATLRIPGRLLAETQYLLTVAFGEPPEKRHDAHENILNFEITGQAFDYKRSIGLLAYPFEWVIEKR